MIEHINIKRRELKPEHIGHPILYINKMHKEYGIINNITSLGVEVFFGGNDSPILLTTGEIKLVKLKTL